MAFFFGKKNKQNTSENQGAEGAPEEKGSWFSRHFSSAKAASAPEAAPQAEAEKPAAAEPVKAAAPAPEPAPEGNSWFARLKKGLTRTRVNLYGLFSGGKIDEEFLEALEDGLITADAGLPAAERIIEQLRDAIKLKGLKTREEVREELIAIVTKLLEPAEKPLDVDRASPLVIMMAGVNGAGKTTSIGKIAKWLASKEKSVLLAAGDTFRAAAREQLEVWGSRNNIHVISQQGADPAAVIFDAVSSAKARGIDIVLADTAGRLPTQAHLMDELTRIKRSQAKALAGAPHEVILVIDGTNGQNALAQVRQFDEAVGLTGLIVTKLDGTAKGGVLLAITAMRESRPLPIYFIGVGESIDDLQPFKAEEFARALIGTDSTHV